MMGGMVRKTSNGEKETQKHERRRRGSIRAAK